MGKHSNPFQFSPKIGAIKHNPLNKINDKASEISHNIARPIEHIAVDNIARPIEHIAVDNIARPIEHIAVDNIARPIEHIAVDNIARPIETFSKDTFKKSEKLFNDIPHFTSKIGQSLMKTADKKIKSIEDDIISDSMYIALAAGGVILLIMMM
jgi:hypothetical protein